MGVAIGHVFWTAAPAVVVTRQMAASHCIVRSPKEYEELGRLTLGTVCTGQPDHQSPLESPSSTCRSNCFKCGPFSCTENHDAKRDFTFISFGSVKPELEEDSCGKGTNYARLFILDSNL